MERAAVVMPSAGAGHGQWRCDVSGDVPPLWICYSEGGSFSQEGRGSAPVWRHGGPEGGDRGNREHLDRPRSFGRTGGCPTGGSGAQSAAAGHGGGLGLKGTGTYWFNEAPQGAPTLAWSRLEATKTSAASRGWDNVHGFCCRFFCDLKDGCRCRSRRRTAQEPDTALKQEERQRSVHRCFAWVTPLLWYAPNEDLRKLLALCTTGTAGVQWPEHLDGPQLSPHTRFPGKFALVNFFSDAHVVNVMDPRRL